MKNFINLTYKEKLMVLDWRNNIRTRINMYSLDKISIENHLKFIDSLINDKENKYFLVENVGVIYFNNIKNNKAEIGLYSNPKKYAQGNFLMEKILTFKYKYLYLKVFKDNEKAIKLYLKYNFILVKEELINNKKILYMELITESAATSLTV